MPIGSKCTQVCGGSFGGKSCAKTILVKVYPKGQPQKAIKTYALLDDQSNASLARSDFFDVFQEHGKELPYTLVSCAGQTSTCGRRASGYVVESINGEARLDLPQLIECNEIPNAKEEIPTPQVALHHQHLLDIASYIPPLDRKADILVLIGRDLPEAHHVLDQRIEKKGSRILHMDRSLDLDGWSLEKHAWGKFIVQTK